MSSTSLNLKVESTVMVVEDHLDMVEVVVVVSGVMQQRMKVMVIFMQEVAQEVVTIIDIKAVRDVMQAVVEVALYDHIRPWLSLQVYYCSVVSMLPSNFSRKCKGKLTCTKENANDIHMC